MLIPEDKVRYGICLIWIGFVTDRAYLMSCVLFVEKIYIHPGNVFYKPMYAKNFFKF